MQKHTKGPVNDRTIVEYQLWVATIVKRVLYSRSLPARYEEDLYSVGILALVEANERYCSSRNVPFKAFAYLRVRGAMIDFLRKNGDSSKKYTYDDSTLEEACNRSKDIPLPDLLAEVSIIRNKLNQLSPIKKSIIDAIYFKDCSLKSISRKLKRSSSWISRQHYEALAELAASYR